MIGTLGPMIRNEKTNWFAVKYYSITVFEWTKHITTNSSIFVWIIKALVVKSSQGESFATIFGKN